MLLDDIINLATDHVHSLTDLLRKCIVLAHQLKNDRLKNWANKELNGYDPEDELPPYRVLTTIAKGNFVGSFGRQLRNWEIPALLLEEKHRSWANTTPLIHPISGYEDLAGGKEGTVHSPWDPNLVLYYQQKISNQDYYLVSAWQEISRSAIVGMLDTVRNRVLNMALEIQTEIGDSDKDLKKITPEESKKVDQTVVTHIYGGNVYMGTGQSTMNATTIQQQQQNIATGDWDHLSQVLRNAGVSQPELDELSTAVSQDGQKLGAKIKHWVGKVGPKVLSGGIKLGAAVGQTVLLEYLKQYFGLKSAAA
jgi:AbiTii-like protein